MSEGIVRGRCLCGDVAWASTGPGELMSHCHCSRCRKTHGSAFATYVALPAAGFRFVRGEERIARFASSPGFERPFCPHCGSVVAGDPEEGRVFMPAGCLDDDPVARPLAHIFVGSMAPWWTIADALPRFEAYPEQWSTTRIEAPALAPPSPGVARGSCLCGGVRFEVRGTHTTIFCCHCSRCRKARAAAHATNLFVPRDAFRWVGGEHRVARFPLPGAERFTQCFCADCGSKLPRVGDTDVAIPMGAFDDDPGARPALHIHVDSMAPWYTIADALPRHAEGPGSPTR